MVATPPIATSTPSNNNGGVNTPAAVPTYLIGGTITGLNAAGLVLQNNGADDLSLSTNATRFQFAKTLVSGAAYNVTVKTQPTDQTCTVSANTGTVSADVTSIQIACKNNINLSTASSGTGAFGVLGTTTARIGFIPSGQTIIPVVLESSVPTTIRSENNPSLRAVTGTPSVTTTFAVDACSVDSNDFKAICIGYASNKIALLDLKTFATSLNVGDITIAEFASGAPNTYNSYSGGKCILCGVAADVGKQRFVVGGNGGFRVFNYNSQIATVVYNIEVGENFALLTQVSPKESYVIAPEYAEKNGQRLLKVINLDNGKTYAWDKHTDNLNDLGAKGTNFANNEVDAAAVDLTTGMIALSTEYKADALLIDFKQAVFDETALSFKAPFAIATPQNNPARQTSFSISTLGSLLLTQTEFDSNVGVMQLPTTSGTGNVFPALTGSLGIFNLNDAVLTPSSKASCGAGINYYFTGKGDPHGVGFFASLGMSQQGLLIDDSNKCAAELDAKALSTVPRKASAPDYLDTSVTGFANMVKFIKIQ